MRVDSSTIYVEMVILGVKDHITSDHLTKDRILQGGQLSLKTYELSMAFSGLFVCGGE